jgi:hypothetical protein
MNIQVHAAAESLRETHGSACRRAKPGQPGALALRAEDLVHKDSPHCGQSTRIAGE